MSFSLSEIYIRNCTATAFLIMISLKLNWVSLCLYFFLFLLLLLIKINISEVLLLKGKLEQVSLVPVIFPILPWAVTNDLGPSAKDYINLDKISKCSVMLTSFGAKWHSSGWTITTEEKILFFPLRIANEGIRWTLFSPGKAEGQIWVLLALNI